MRVNPKDGCCRSCGGTLVIVDADDATMQVECDECGEFYDVETDAFHDGAMFYYPEVMAQKFRRGGSE
jgi:transcription elongation factor Elf1